MKRPERRIETEKDEGAGGGDKAWNLGKKSSSFLFPLSSLRPVRIKKTFVGMPNTYMLQTVTQIFNNVCYPA